MSVATWYVNLPEFIKTDDSTFSPDCKMLAYVADNNIWLAKFDFDTESASDKDGEIYKIIMDQQSGFMKREFGTTRLMEFSPTASCSLLSDSTSHRSGVSVSDILPGTYPGFYSYKYPKAGERKRIGGAAVFDIDSRTIRKMDLPLESDDIFRG
jgi:dipeptidyl-peptidase-4